MEDWGAGSFGCQSERFVCVERKGCVYGGNSDPVGRQREYYIGPRGDDLSTSNQRSLCCRYEEQQIQEKVATFRLMLLEKDVNPGGKEETPGQRPV